MLRLASLLFMAGCLSASIPASGFVWSNGSDGAFNPTSSASLNLDRPEAPGMVDGVFNFTTIHIPANVTLGFQKNPANTPIFLFAQGDVVIEGSIIVSQRATSTAPGPGGYAGGSSGFGDATCAAAAASGCRYATAGEGLAGGLAGGPAVAGSPKSHPGGGGSGGGLGTEGLVVTAYAGPNALASDTAPFPNSLVGGSGGGGGGGWMFFGVELGGGAGGGGGGALRIATEGTITIGGIIVADGQNGGWSFANVGGFGGPGGGGSGGIIDLLGASIDILPAAHLTARGGYGGGFSTEPYDRDPALYSKGADGGLGYVRLVSPNIANQGFIEAQVIAIPEPAIWLQLAAGLALIGCTLRRRSTG